MNDKLKTIKFFDVGSQYILFEVAQSNMSHEETLIALPFHMKVFYGLSSLALLYLYRAISILHK